MRTRVLHRLAAGLAASLVCACTEAPTAPDAGSASDVGPPPTVPFSLSIGEPGEARLEVSSDPLRLVLRDPSGAVLVESGAEGFFVGHAPGGDARFHEPTVDVPPGVTWEAWRQGAGATGPTSGVLRGASGASASVALSRVGVEGYRLRVETDAADAALSRVVLATREGHYDGLGERFEGADARGRVVPMQFSVSAGIRESSTNEAHVPIPFLVHSSGVGLFVETREAGAFDVGATDPDEVRVSFEGRVLDLVFFVAPTPREVVAAYTRHTGRPILPPRWAFAPMHWRNEWASRAVLEEDAAAIRRLDIPCTAFWIDNPWQTSYNDLRFDASRFPDPPGMLAALRDEGFRPLVWSTPYLDAPEPGETPDNPAEALYAEAAAQGWLVRDRASAPLSAPSAAGCCEAGGMIDFTSEGAVSFWQARIDPVVALGVRAFKLDYGEDIVPSFGAARLPAVFSDGRTARELHNVYSTLYHVPYRRALDSGSDEGGFLLVRAESWGGQAVADVIWPGDLDNDFSRADARNVGGLPAAISALVSLSASGFPHFGSDTGGYRGGMPTREALLRWAEHTAFTPILQLGGAGEHHNPWLYDDEAGRLYQRLARAHMDLVPYLRMLAVRAHTDGTPTVLHPGLAYPDDPGSRVDPDAYLLGEDLFVAPVVEEGATERRVHLPPGRWVHWFTGTEAEGDVTVPAPLGAPPVFVRVGALVPLGPPDLDTLVEAPPPLVTPSMRPYLRVRSLPAGDRRIVTEEGLAVRVEHTGASLRVTVERAPGGISDARLELALDHAAPALSLGATRVAVGGADVPAIDVAAVQDGCDGVCWAREGGTLWLSTRGEGTTSVEITP